MCIVAPRCFPSSGKQVNMGNLLIARLIFVTGLSQLMELILLNKPSYYLSLFNYPNILLNVIWGVTFEIITSEVQLVPFSNTTSFALFSFTSIDFTLLFSLISTPFYTANSHKIFDNQPIPPSKYAHTPFSPVIEPIT